ncbi:MAG: hypothetical protein ACOY7L_17100 [Pseudomonadota bacterium]
MAQIGPISLTLTGAADNAVQSIQSALAAIEASGSAPHGFDDLFAGLGSGLGADLREDAVDLFFAEPVLRTADGALECALKPSQRYIELVAAIARDGNVAVDCSGHGWPVLSIVSPNTIVADAGGAAIPPAEGCA